MSGPRPARNAVLVLNRGGKSRGAMRKREILGKTHRPCEKASRPRNALPRRRDCDMSPESPFEARTKFWNAIDRAWKEVPRKTAEKKSDRPDIRRNILPRAEGSKNVLAGTKGPNRRKKRGKKTADEAGLQDGVLRERFARRKYRIGERNKKGTAPSRLSKKNPAKGSSRRKRPKEDGQYWIHGSKQKETTVTGCGGRNQNQKKPKFHQKGRNIKAIAAGGIQWGKLSGGRETKEVPGDAMTLR